MATKKAVEEVQVTEDGVKLEKGFVNGEEVLYDPTIPCYSTDGHRIYPFAPEVNEEELPLDTE